MKDSANCEDTLRKGKLPKSEEVRKAALDAGAHKRAVDKQVGVNGNPKKRTTNTWGVKEN